MKPISKLFTVGTVTIGLLASACSAAPAPSPSHQALADSTWGSVADNKWLIRVASFPNVCGILQEMTEVANSSEIEITMASAAGQTAIPAGSYPVASTGIASAKFNVWDSTCAKTLKVAASGGTITLTSTLGLPGVSSSGSYDLQFVDGSHKAGSFSAGFCTTANQGGAGTCLGGVAGTSSGAGGGSSGGGGGNSIGTGGGAPGSGGTSAAAQCNDGPGTCTFPGGAADHCRNGAVCARQCPSCDYSCFVACSKDAECAGFCTTSTEPPVRQLSCGIRHTAAQLFTFCE